MPDPTGRHARPKAEPVATAATDSLGRCDHVDAVTVDLAAGTTAVEFTRTVQAATPQWVHRMPSGRDASCPLSGPRGRAAAAPVVGVVGWV